MTYNQYIIPQFGEAQVFHSIKCKQPIIKDDQVLIKNHYIGVNYADVIARKGYYKWAGKPPICPGFECSGEIVEVGKDSNFKIGDKVIVLCRFGAYSEYVTATNDRVRKVPEGMSLKQAAAFPAVYFTAYHCLNEIMRIQPGESILIQAIAGGVGTAALQIAKAKGAIVYGTASTAEKLQYARGLGLDHAINYKTQDFEKVIKKLTKNNGVKFLLDSLGGEGLRKGMNCLSRQGHAVTIGAAEVVPPSGLGLKSLMQWPKVAKAFIKGGLFHPFTLIEKNVGLSGVQILLLWDQVDHLNKIYDGLIELYKKGLINPQVNHEFPLSQVDKAHEFMENRLSRGKIVLKT